MQIQRIGYSVPTFGKGQTIVPKTKDEKAAYDTMYKYFSDYYSDCDPDYGDANDPTAVRNLIAANRELAEKARADAQSDNDLRMLGGGSTSDDFDVDRCFDVVV